MKAIKEDRGEGLKWILVTRPRLANWEKIPSRPVCFFGPRGLVFSHGTRLKYITDAVSGLPALTAHLQNAAWLTLWSTMFLKMPKVSNRMDNRKCKGAAEKVRIKTGILYKQTWLHLLNRAIFSYNQLTV